MLSLYLFPPLPIWFKLILFLVLYPPIISFGFFSPSHTTYISKNNIPKVKLFLANTKNKPKIQHPWIDILSQLIVGNYSNTTFTLKNIFNIEFYYPEIWILSNEYKAFLSPQSCLFLLKITYCF